MFILPLFLRQGHYRQWWIRKIKLWRNIWQRFLNHGLYLLIQPKGEGAEVIFAMPQWIMQSYFWYQTTFNCHINPACLHTTLHYLTGNAQLLESQMWSRASEAGMETQIWESDVCCTSSPPSWVHIMSVAQVSLTPTCCGTLNKILHLSGIQFFIFKVGVERIIISVLQMRNSGTEKLGNYSRSTSNI